MTGTSATTPTSKGFGISDPAFETLPVATQKTWLSNWAALGISWVRIEVPWSSVAPTQTSSPQWELFDNVIALINSYGMKVDAIVERPPLWAAASASCPMSTNWCPPKDVNAFAAFAQSVVARYGNQLSGIEVWNEPNLSRFWWPQPDPLAYTQLLQATYTAIRSVNSTVPVISGGLSPSGSVSFLSSMYADGAKDYMSAVGYHPYSFPALVSDVESYSGWSMLSATSPSVRSVMAANGDSAKQVWATEVGAPTGGSYGVSEQTQSDILVGAIEQSKTLTWMGPLFLYEYQDLGTDPNDSEQHFGMLTSSGVAKPSLAAVRAAIAD